MVIYAVDDEPILLEKLKQAIKEAAPRAEIFSFSRASMLLEAMNGESYLPQVVFLDIELPGMGGMELAKQIKKRSPKTSIVFVTGFSEYAIEAFEMHAQGYILKPVTAERVQKELAAIAAEKAGGDLETNIRVKCFGNFEVYVHNKLLKFERSKAKELFAYLIDRNGSSVNTAELCAVLWEDQMNMESKRNYLRKLVISLSKTLDSVGAGDIFIKSRNSFAVDVNKINCDYYTFLKNNPNEINNYNGEYMTQYSWSEVTLGKI